MALINCPECNQRISDQAENCPKCGHPINPTQPIRQKREGCFLQTLNIGCLMVLVVLGILVILIFALTIFRFQGN